MHTKNNFIKPLGSLTPDINVQRDFLTSPDKLYPKSGIEQNTPGMKNTIIIFNDTDLNRALMSYCRSRNDLKIYSGYLLESRS